MFALQCKTLTTHHRSVTVSTFLTAEICQKVQNTERTCWLVAAAGSVVHLPEDEVRVLDEQGHLLQIDQFLEAPTHTIKDHLSVH